jgi:hypothetical protein
MTGTRKVAGLERLAAEKDPELAIRMAAAKERLESGGSLELPTLEALENRSRELRQRFADLGKRCNFTPSIMFASIGNSAYLGSTLPYMGEAILFKNMEYMEEFFRGCPDDMRPEVDDALKAWRELHDDYVFISRQRKIQSRAIVR